MDTGRVCAINSYKGKGNDMIDPKTRVFICNIPTHLNNESLVNYFKTYGDVEIYTYQNGENDSGWAFVGFSSRDGVRNLTSLYRAL